MDSTRMALVLGIAAAFTSLSAHADPHRKEARGGDRNGWSMQEVTHGAQSGQAGYRWRYFADTRQGRAVAISPGGDYFYGHGRGLTLVYKSTVEPPAS